QQPPFKPPYPPSTATLGGQPTRLPDIPVSAVLLAFFIGSAATHLTIFVRNKRKAANGVPHAGFFFSFLCFIFSMTRIAALSLRIAWTEHPTNANVALAATVMTAAGVLILFIVNLVLTRRVVRGLHPGLGWHRAVTNGFKVLLATVIGMLIMVVICSVHSVFTLDVGARTKERQVTLFASVYLTVMAVTPAVVAPLAYLIPNRGARHPAEGFGKGSMGGKVALLTCASLLLALGAGFRAGTNFAAKPIGQEQWYHSKPAFYCFNFVVEILVVYSYAIFRFDRRFRVPDGSAAPGHYSNGGPEVEEGEEVAHELRNKGTSSGDDSSRVV
ncbi:uncharacterized protein C8A04DRAFT_12987, partial [Dichotomopilus funicola]